MIKHALWALLLCLLLTSYASAQVDARAQQNLERFERQLDQVYRTQRREVNRDVPVGQRMLLEYGGTLTFSFLALDDTDQETHILRQSSASVFAHLNFDGAHDFFVRIGSSYDDFNTGDAFDEDGDDWVEPTLDRAVYTFDLRQYMAAYHGTPPDFNVIFQGGRQLVHWANGLALSEELDGALVTITRDPFELELLAATTRSSVNDFETSRPSYDNDTHRNFYGAKLTYNKLARHQPFIYGFMQKDDNEDEVLVVDTGIGLATTRFHYDSHYIGVGSQGALTDRLAYAVEAVYQGGEGLSNSYDQTLTPVTQTEEDISAWAFNARLDYVMPGPNRTRLSAELLLASGDEDRGHTSNTLNGNTSGTDDRAFNGFGLVDTGLAFSPNASNLIMTRVGASTFPLPNSRHFKRLQIGGNFFTFHKMEREGGITETTSDDSFLGVEPGVYAIWQATSDVLIQARYGVFFPGTAIQTDNDERHFFYTGVSYSF